jgi:RNA polymerase sigma-70 factor (ECF subfamily)
MSLDIVALEAHRPALTGHCYRMLGSPTDAEDAVQEAMVRAWKSLDRFEERSSVKTWLYRIATNVCLDALAERSRRRRPMEEGPVGTVHDELSVRARSHWLEPVPDAHLVSADDDPFEQAAMRESVKLAFVSALQHLPPKQRAALLLTDVIGWSAAEAASCLETSVASINSALQRARATLTARGVSAASARHPQPLTDAQVELLERYVEAFDRYDVDALVALLREDATLSMPPYTLWLQGPAVIREWLAGRGAGCRGSKLMAVDVNGSRGFAQYRPGVADGPYRAWGIIVLELSGPAIASWNTFLDTEHLFPLFGLPLEWPAE